MRPVTINKVLNGYIVQVGCQTLVFRYMSNLVKELKRYADNPEQVEKEYLAKHKPEYMQVAQAQEREARLMRADEQYRRDGGCVATQPYGDARVPFPASPGEGGCATQGRL